MNGAGCSAGLLGRILAPALLLAGCFLVYWKVCDFGFVMFDDDINLYLNARLGPLSLDRVAWAFSDTSTMLRYLPLGWLAWSAVFTVAGMEPWAYHAVVVVAHAASTGLVYAIFWRMLGRGGAGEEEGKRRRNLAAALGAAFWGLHPLRVEIVAWASGMAYALATTWMLLSAWLFFEGEHRRGQPAAARRYFAGALLAYLGSLLSYPLALGYPLALLAWVAWKRNWLAGMSDWRGRLREAWVPLAALGLAGLCALGALAVRSGPAGRWNPPAALEDFGLAQRAAQAAYLVVEYLFRTLCPDALSPIYGSLEQVDPLKPKFWIALLLVAGASAVALRAVFAPLLASRFPLRASPLSSSGSAALWLWVAYLGLLAPHLGLFEHPYYPCDRYSYVPGLVFGLVVALVVRALPEGKGGTPAVVAACIAVAGLGWAAAQQVETWRDTRSLLGCALERMGRSVIRPSLMGRLALEAGFRGDLVAARQRMAEAERVFPRAPELAEVRQRLASVGAGLEQKTERVVAPLAMETHRMAMEAWKAGRRREALARFEQTLSVDPGYAQARYNYALVLAERGELEEARRQHRLLKATKGVGGIPAESMNELARRLGP
jgi:tetratricopeptide (TPR) repeat protein